MVDMIPEQRTGDVASNVSSSALQFYENLEVEKR